MYILNMFSTQISSEYTVFYSFLSYTEIGRHIINQSNNVIYEDRKNQVYGIG
ncbi:hypothetical protein SAMN05660349_00002 [Macellibacteroides fermentans]|uniref:Uncharacterized protein n=1 Tax=Parabacteroides chartae TaxID=1037355 RepID=A0A1T4ZR62_9BACT|nr:hypothetical protein SAMN05660349_00002 [Parabacteroides chartae]